MKRNLLVAALAIATFSSCDELKSLVDITHDVEYKATVDVPSFPGLPVGLELPNGGQDIELPSMKVATNSSDFLKDANTDASLVKTLKMKSFVTTMLKPADGNFNYIDKIQVYMAADGLSEVLAAEKQNIGKGIQRLELDVKDLNLKDYFLKDSVGIRIKAHFVAVPDSNSQMQLAPTITILANPLN